jgi:hypothetical protein
MGVLEKPKRVGNCIKEQYRQEVEVQLGSEPETSLSKSATLDMEEHVYVLRSPSAV